MSYGFDFDLLLNKKLRGWIREELDMLNEKVQDAKGRHQTRGLENFKQKIKAYSMLSTYLQEVQEAISGPKTEADIEKILNKISRTWTKKGTFDINVNEDIRLAAQVFFKRLLRMKVGERELRALERFNQELNERDEKRKAAKQQQGRPTPTKGKVDKQPIVPEEQDFSLYARGQTRKEPEQEKPAGRPTGRGRQDRQDRQAFPKMPQRDVTQREPGAYDLGFDLGFSPRESKHGDELDRATLDDILRRLDLHDRNIARLYKAARNLGTKIDTRADAEELKALSAMVRDLRAQLQRRGPQNLQDIQRRLDAIDRDIANMTSHFKTQLILFDKLGEINDRQQVIQGRQQEVEQEQQRVAQAQQQMGDEIQSLSQRIDSYDDDIAALRATDERLRQALHELGLHIDSKVDVRAIEGLATELSAMRERLDRIEQSGALDPNSPVILNITRNITQGMDRLQTQIQGFAAEFERVHEYIDRHVQQEIAKNNVAQQHIVDNKIETVRAALSADIKRYDAQIRALQEADRKLQQDITAVSGRVDTKAEARDLKFLGDELASLQRQVAGIRVPGEQAARDVKQIQGRMKEISTVILGLDGRFERIREILSQDIDHKIAQEREATDAKITALEARIETRLEARLEQYDAEFKALREEDRALSERINGKADVKALQDVLGQLEDLRQQLREIQVPGHGPGVGSAPDILQIRQDIQQINVVLDGLDERFAEVRQYVDDHVGQEIKSNNERERATTNQRFEKERKTTHAELEELRKRIGALQELATKLDQGMVTKADAKRLLELEKTVQQLQEQLKQKPPAEGPKEPGKDMGDAVEGIREEIFNIYQNFQDNIRFEMRDEFKHQAEHQQSELQRRLAELRQQMEQELQGRMRDFEIEISSNNAKRWKERFNQESQKLVDVQNAELERERARLEKTIHQDVYKSQPKEEASLIARLRGQNKSQGYIDNEVANLQRQYQIKFDTLFNNARAEAISRAQQQLNVKIKALEISVAQQIRAENDAQLSGRFERERGVMEARLKEVEEALRKEFTAGLDRVNGIVTQQGEKITQQGERITQQGGRIDALGRTVDEHGQVLGRHGADLKQYDERLGQHDTDLKQQGDRITQQNGRIDDLGRTVDEHGETLGRQNTAIQQQRERTAALGRTVSEHDQRLGQHAAALEQHRASIDHHGEVLGQHGGDIKQQGEDIGLLKEDLKHHHDRLGQHSTALDQHAAALDRHTDEIGQHNARLGQHDADIKQQAENLGRVGRTVQQQGERLREHDTTLGQQGVRMTAIEESLRGLDFAALRDIQTLDTKQLREVLRVFGAVRDRANEAYGLANNAMNRANDAHTLAGNANGAAAAAQARADVGVADAARAQATADAAAADAARAVAGVMTADQVKAIIKIQSSRGR